jgi:hypothetical protein
MAAAYCFAQPVSALSLAFAVVLSPPLYIAYHLYIASNPRWIQC